MADVPGPEVAVERAPLHVMVREAANATEVLYACPVEGCGRRLVLGTSRPSLTVLDRGDLTAAHVAEGGLEVLATIAGEARQRSGPA
jgi:hypothetical protein